MGSWLDQHPGSRSTQRQHLAAVDILRVRVMEERRSFGSLDCKPLMEKEGRSHGIHEARKQRNGRISNMSLWMGFGSQTEQWQRSIEARKISTKKSRKIICKFTLRHPLTVSFQVIWRIVPENEKALIRDRAR